MGYWLQRTFGAPSTTGEDPDYVHVFSSGSETIPTFGMQIKKGPGLYYATLGCAINSVQPAGRSFATLELKVNLIRPLRHEVGEVRCEATVIYAGNRTATSEGKVVDANGRIYAHGTTTCILVERDRPRAETL